MGPVRKYQLLAQLDRGRPPRHYSSSWLDGQHRLEAAAATLSNYTYSAGFLWNRGETNGAIDHEKVSLLSVAARPSDGELSGGYQPSEQ